MKKKKVNVNDKMQKGYVYYLTELEGKNFEPSFKPELTPRQMLELGVFGGIYMRDCKKEFPHSWFKKAKFSDENKRQEDINFFKINASQSLKVWRKNGWINKKDPRGWFQWYCRYYMGRRMPEEDKRQIQRWKNMKRHVTWLQNACKKKDLRCRPKQRQALLHWAYDSRKL
jgi:hypothetical protein